MNRQFLIQNILGVLDISNYRLAQITGIHRSTIGRWVRGVENMDNGSLFQLMIFFMMETKDKDKTLELFTPYVKNIGEYYRIKGTLLTLSLGEGCNEK